MKSHVHFCHVITINIFPTHCFSLEKKMQAISTVKEVFHALKKIAGHISQSFGFEVSLISLIKY